MALIYCGACERASRDASGFCVHCGMRLIKRKPPEQAPPAVAVGQPGTREATPPPPETIGSARRAPAACASTTPQSVTATSFIDWGRAPAAGAAVIVAGAFAPLVTLPMLGTARLLDVGGLAAIFIVAGSVLSAILIMRGFNGLGTRLAWAATFTIAYLFSRMALAVALTKRDLASPSGEADLISGFFDMVGAAMAFSIKLQWGWLLFFLGAALLLAPSWLAAARPGGGGLRRKVGLLVSGILVAAILAAISL